MTTRSAVELGLTERLLDHTHLSMWDVVHRGARRHPDRPAVSMGEREWTYRELHDRALEAAARLAELGVGRGTRVAFWFHACPEWAALHYALARLGAVAVPVSLAFETDEVRHVLRSAEPELLVVVEDFRGVGLADRVERLDLTEFPSVRQVVVLPLLDDERLDPVSPGARLLFGDLAGRPGLDPVGPARASDPAYIVFTSGSTAFPKPAVCTHAAFLGSATGFAEALELGPEDRFLAMLPTFHVGGVACVVSMPHLYGACAGLMGGFAAELALITAEQRHSTVTVGFDAMFTKMIESADYRPERVVSLRRAAVAATATFIERLCTRWPLDLVATTYGCTESGGLAAITPAWIVDRERRTRGNGCVLPGVDLVVVDPSTGERRPTGVAGEIRLRGWGRVVEYLDMPEETADALDPDGYFCTGDIGLVDEDGFLHFNGREKMMIKTGGENVAEREVEIFLERELDPVEVAQGVGLPDETWGEVVVACVQLSAPHTTEELRALAAGRIARYKIPRHFVALRAEVFPVLANGRPDKKALRSLAEARVRRQPCVVGLAESDARSDGYQERRTRSWARLLDDLEGFAVELLADLREADAGAPSLCEGWTTRDVVLHLEVGDDLAERTLRGENCFPDPTDDEHFLTDLGRANVAALGDVPYGEALERFADVRARLLVTARSFDTEALGERVPWAAGTISRFAAVHARFMETSLHAWDVRRPAGIPQPLDDRAWWVSDLAVRTLPYALSKAGRSTGPARVVVELDGTGGGSWDRPLFRGGEQDRPLEVRGPAWAWLALASRRPALADAAVAALAESPVDDAPTALGTVRAFA